jgi:hypothetical protein
MATDTPEAWAAFRTWMAWAHPDGAQVVDEAQRLGCKLSQCLHITISGEQQIDGGYPVAYFGTPERFQVVQPNGGGVYTRRPRGTGPEIDPGRAI